MLSLERLAADTPPGPGRRRDPHEERVYLMRFFVHTLGLSVAQAANALSVALRVFLGIEAEPEAIRLWWYRLSPSSRR